MSDSMQGNGQLVRRPAMSAYRGRILLVGTHLPQDVGGRSVAEALADKLRPDGFQTTVTSRNRHRLYRVVDMLFTIWFARNNYDIANVDVYSGSAFRWAEWMTRLLRQMHKPVILTLHGGNLPLFGRAHPRRMSRLFAEATAVIAPSAYLAEAMRGIRKDILVIPNAIEIESYTYRERDRPAPRLIWLRAFHEIYNPGLAIRVLAKIATEFEDAQLVMVGADKDGSLAAVRAEAIRLGVFERVTFTGGIAKSEVPRFLEGADIFLNTTTIDNTPVSVLEAFATGLLVVSTSVGGIPYLIENNVDGILVRTGDADSMAHAIKRLLRESDFAGMISRNARRKAESFGWNSVLPQWERLFLQISTNGSAK